MHGNLIDRGVSGPAIHETPPVLFLLLHSSFLPFWPFLLAD